MQIIEFFGTVHVLLKNCAVKMAAAAICAKFVPLTLLYECCLSYRILAGQ